MYLAVSTTGPALGALGAGGIALALTVFLILGVKGQGKVKLKDNPAILTAFLAGTSFHAAGAIWGHADQITRQGLTGLGIGNGHSVLGNIGIALPSLLVLIFMLCWRLNPARGAALGLIAALVWPLAGAGSIFAAPSELAAGVLLMIGGA